MLLMLPKSHPVFDIQSVYRDYLSSNVSNIAHYHFKITSFTYFAGLHNKIA